MSNKTKLETDLFYQERLDNLGIIALNVIESLLTDTETSIDVRLHAAFKIIEVYGSDKDKMGDGITQAITESIENNGQMIKNNTKRLAEIGTICEIFKEKQIG